MPTMSAMKSASTPRAIETGNAYLALDGFFIGDFAIELTEEGDKVTVRLGEEKDELFFKSTIGVEAALFLLAAEAGVGGSISFNAGLDLQDINHDGKIRVSEILLMAQHRRAPVDPDAFFDLNALGGLLNLVNISAELTGEIFVFADLGSPPAGGGHDFSLTLLEFDLFLGVVGRKHQPSNVRFQRKGRFQRHAL